MTVEAVAFVPHPPLLVPEIASGAAAELDALRAACDRAVAAALASRPEQVVLVGGGEPGERRSATGSFAPWGMPVDVRLGGGGPDPLPLSLAVGTWLLHRAGWDGAETAFGVAPDADPATCAALGTELDAGVEGRGRRTALVVLGDGTACRSPQAPRGLDPRAEPFDRAVEAALANADRAALAALDPDLATDLYAAGRAPWQVAAGVPADWTAELLFSDVPYGVCYLAATWRRA